MWQLSLRKKGLDEKLIEFLALSRGTWTEKSLRPSGGVQKSQFKILSKNYQSIL
jgi:hypothetical protein